MLKSILSLAALAALGLSVQAASLPSVSTDATPVVVAKRGADDPAGDDRGKDGAGHKAKQSTTVAKNGADDPAGDDRGGRGRGGDGPGHKAKQATTVAKHGADDPAGDDRGGRRGGRG